jgi:DNA-binding response OmpR family regulator
MQNTILVIDDDVNISKIISLYLEKEGFRAIVAHDGAEGLKTQAEEKADLIILDIMMPVMDGWDTLKELRKTSNAPVIMLSAKGETFDKVLGLELGADDYIVKPFEPKEMIARVKAVIRRTDKKEDTDEQKLIQYEGLSVNLSDYRVVYNGTEVDMPPKEIELLYYLASKPNKVFTREQLLQQVWDFDFYGDSRTVDVHIKRIREKLGEENNSWQIKTVWGVGYKFEVK